MVRSVVCVRIWKSVNRKSYILYRDEYFSQVFFQIFWQKRRIHLIGVKYSLSGQKSWQTWLCIHYNLQVLIQERSKHMAIYLSWDWCTRSLDQLKTQTKQTQTIKETVCITQLKEIQSNQSAASEMPLLIQLITYNCRVFSVCF